MARVVEYYVEGREWSGREEGVREVSEWKSEWEWEEVEVEKKEGE